MLEVHSREPMMPKLLSDRMRDVVLLLLVVALLSALPLAVWADLRNLSETSLRRQASDLNAAITSIRDYYADQIVARVQASPGRPRFSRITRRCPARSRSRRRFRSSSDESSVDGNRTFHIASCPTILSEIGRPIRSTASSWMHCDRFAISQTSR
jgi:hypothetical protein